MTPPDFASNTLEAYQAEIYYRMWVAEQPAVHVRPWRIVDIELPPLNITWDGESPEDDDIPF
jgi:hypothetical protein